MKRALLVGIDDYSLSGSDLSNCVEDVTVWCTLLIGRYDFRKDNIRLLVNDRATKENVLKNLNWLVADAGEGDTLVFFYSGHGATFRERDELGYPDEAKDEALKLYGLGTSSLLIDDELSRIVSHLSPAANLSIICDCCFSGGMSDGLKSGMESEEVLKAKYHPMETDPDKPTRRFGLCLSKKDGQTALDNQDFSPAKSLLIAACREDEFASQGGPATGWLSAFSYFTLQVLCSPDLHMSARELIERIRQKMAEGGFSQTPQLKGRSALFERSPFG
jgi:hypothetical protein